MRPSNRDNRKTILSLCDFSGNWAYPYAQHGFNTILVDLKHGLNVLTYIPPPDVFGVLAAPPCTVFTRASGRYWKLFDQTGATNQALDIVRACLSIIRQCQPKFWALENPPGRLNHWLGPPQMSFDPCDFGDPYTKRTLLWGNFCPPWHHPIIPQPHPKNKGWTTSCKAGHKRRSEVRSTTPLGFSYSFFEANH